MNGFEGWNLNIFTMTFENYDVIKREITLIKCVIDKDGCSRQQAK
jgi:hypothetical protein